MPLETLTAVITYRLRDGSSNIRDLDIGITAGIITTPPPRMVGGHFAPATV